MAGARRGTSLMVAAATFRTLHCLVCDDVRQEAANKETIVGVYTAGIVIPQLPYSLMLSFWLAVIWSGDGQLGIEFRVIDPVREVRGYTNGTAQSVWPGHESSLAFRHLLVDVRSEGAYEVQVRSFVTEWETVRRLPIHLARS